jgi:hypothetical protein
MNRKYLALIGVIIALSIIVAALLFQSFTVNNAANATAKADSFEMELKDALSGDSVPTFTDYNLANSTMKAEAQYELANFTKVSETTFLNDLGISQGWESFASPYIEIDRVYNTFYLYANEYGNGGGTTIQVQFSFSYTPITYTPPPTPIPEQAKITNAVFNNSAQITPQVSSNGFDMTFINNSTATIASCTYSYYEIPSNILLNSIYYNLTITTYDTDLPLAYITYTNPFDFTLNIALEGNYSQGLATFGLYNASYLESILSNDGYVGDIPMIYQILPHQTINAIAFPSSFPLFLDISVTGTINLEQALQTILTVYPVATPTEVEGQIVNLGIGDSQTVSPANGYYISEIGNISSSCYQVIVTVQNTGTNTVKIVSATIDDNVATFTGTPTVLKGNTATFTISSSTTFINNQPYVIELTTASGSTLLYRTIYSTP